MKKQNGKDTKKAAANDKDVKVEERYSLGSIATVKRGFLLEFVKFVEKKGTVDAETLYGPCDLPFEPPGLNCVPERLN
jgi:hypothetical protein